MITCPKCQHEFKSPHAVKGGSRRVAKGFSSPSVQAKAQAALRTKRALDSARKNKMMKPYG